MISKKDCARVVDSFLDAIKEALQEQKNIEVRGFGTFKIRHRKTRMARNPRTGSPVEVSARPVPVFKPSKELRAMVANISVEELEPQVLSLGLWKLNATVAERFVQGRVLLCGDAAHQFPPTGGLGVNTGLQGMHNAMWKLAWYVLGRAGWDLVATYETERREVAQRITSQSLQNSINVQMISAAAISGASGSLPPAGRAGGRCTPKDNSPDDRIAKRKSPTSKLVRY